MLGGLIIGGVALGLFLWANAHEETKRRMWLINGIRYAIAARMTGPGWDASMFPGFCNFSEPVMTGQGETSAGVRWVEVQFTANWCQANLQWDVPENISISEVH